MNANSHVLRAVANRRSSRFVTILAVLAAFQWSAASCRANSAVYLKTLPSTAWILTSDAMGSGVVVSTEKRLVLTNHHVVGDESYVQVVFPQFVHGRCRAERQYYIDHLDNLAIKGKVIAVDKERDLGLVQLASLPKNVRAIQLGKPVHPGDDVHSLGNPGASDALWIYTFGKVRSVYYKAFRSRIPHRMEVIEITSPINPGDSGGPIVNDRGELVGLSQSYLVDGRLVSYGVNISEIGWFLDRAKHPRHDRPTLPVGTDRSTVTGLTAGFSLALAKD